MAEAVAEAIEAPAHLMVEAGTGVGKSFAYLVPAILAAAELGKKVVVSTHTISLQEQLLQKDIPFLRAVMPQEFTAVLVKGRSNYISLRRLDGAVARGRGDVPVARGVRAARRDPGLGGGDRGREPVGPRLPPRAERLGRRGQRERQLPGPGMPAAPRLLLLQGQAADAIGEHPGRQPRPVPDATSPSARRGRASSPSTTWRSSTRRTRSRPWRASTSGSRSPAARSSTCSPACSTSGRRRGCSPITASRRRRSRSRRTRMAARRLLRRRRRLAGEAGVLQRPAPEPRAVARQPGRGAAQARDGHRPRGRRGRGRGAAHRADRRAGAVRVAGERPLDLAGPAGPRERLLDRGRAGAAASRHPGAAPRSTSGRPCAPRSSIACRPAC